MAMTIARACPRSSVDQNLLVGVVDHNLDREADRMVVSLDVAPEGHPLCCGTSGPPDFTIWSNRPQLLDWDSS